MTAPVRVLFPFAGGDLVGGSHQSALRLAAGLDRSRFEPVVLVHGEGGKVARFATQNGLLPLRLDRPAIIAPRYSRRPEDASAPGYLLMGVPRFARLLRALAIDIVHTNDGRMHLTWALPARLAGCRLIWHHRGDPEAWGVNRVAPLLAHRVVSVSDFSCPAHPVRPLGERLRVIRSPFDQPAAQPDRAACAEALRARIGAAPGAVVLGYFGALNGRKRSDHFVRAIAEIRRALPGQDIHGAIFGRPERDCDPVERDLRALAASLGLAGHIHLMGHVSPVEPALAGVFALLVTARGEPFGRTLIEAMHLGTPVIATRHGGNPEAIEDGRNGFLVDPDDPAAFVAPVRRLLAEPGLAGRITAAARTGLDRYSTAEHLRRVQALYDEVMERE